VSTLGGSRLARNIAANLGGQLAVLVLGLVAARLIFSGLGQEALGIVLFVLTFNLVLAGILDFGFSSVTVREVAAHVEDDPGYVRDLVRTASSLYWATFAVAAGLLVLAAPWIATSWIHLQAMSPRDASAVMRVLGVAALTALPRALYVSLFRGLQRMAFNNGIDAAIGVLQQFGIVLIVLVGGGLFSVVVWLASTYGLQIVVYWLVLARVISPWALIPGWSGLVIRRNARFSAHMLSISWLAAVHTYADKLVVSKLLSVATFGWYTFATSIVARGALVTQAIGDAAYPSLSKLFKENKRPAMVAQYRALQDLVCFATFPLYAGIAYLTLPLLTAVFDRQVAVALLFPVAVLCLGYFMNGTLVMPYMYSLAVGKPQITSRLSLVAVFVVVPVTVAGVARFGVAGASLGYLSYHLFFYAVAVPRYCRDCLQVPTFSWYAQTGRVAVTGAVTYGLGWVVAWLTAGLAPIALAVAFVIASVTFSILAIRLVDPGLRDAAVAVLRPGARRLLPRKAA
jgi:O-antigen/teichoic acid export membrane protein